MIFFIFIEPFSNISFATSLHYSFCFLEMDTLAVVCDDNIECAEDRDEALCRTGETKYNPFVYAMTACAGMFYVGLKLVWFFHQRHQPMGDEDEDEDMALEEMAAGPSSMSEELDKAEEIFKRDFGNDSDTRE